MFEALFAKIAVAIIKKAALAKGIVTIAKACGIYSVVDSVSDLHHLITLNHSSDLNVYGVKVISGVLSEIAVDRFLSIPEHHFEVRQRKSGLYVASNLAPEFKLYGIDNLPLNFSNDSFEAKENQTFGMPYIKPFKENREEPFNSLYPKSSTDFDFSRQYDNHKYNFNCNIFSKGFKAEETNCPKCGGSGKCRVIDTVPKPIQFLTAIMTAGIANLCMTLDKSGKCPNCEGTGKVSIEYDDEE